MTTRRGLFGLLAGALGVAAGVKAAPGARTIIGIDPARVGAKPVPLVYGACRPQPKMIYYTSFDDVNFSPVDDSLYLFDPEAPVETFEITPLENSPRLQWVRVMSIARQDKASIDG